MKKLVGNRIIYAVACVLTVTLALSSSVQAQGDTLTVGIEFRDWDSFDPHFSISAAVNTANQAIFEGLVGHPPGSFASFRPGLAESWEASEDGLTWTFHLKRGVQWHKGFGEFTSDDVVYSFSRVQDPDLASPFRNRIPIASVEAIDDYTVTISLTSPDPTFLLKLINYHAGNIVSRKAVEAANGDISRNPVGTGPFMFESYTPQEEVVLVRNPDYHGDAPALEGIRFLAIEDRNALDAGMQSGFLDVAQGMVDPLWVERWQGSPFVVDVMDGPGSAAVLYFNLTQPPFDDIRVRQAVAHAIDREALVTNLYGPLASVLHSPVPLTYWGGTDDLPRYDYDPAKARQLLAEAGYPNGLTLSLIQSEQQQMLTPMTIVQEQLRQVGIVIDFEIVDHATQHRLIREDRNPMVYYAAARLPDASQYLVEFFLSSSITAFNRVDTLDASIIEAVQTVDDGERLERYEAIQRAIMEDLYIVPLFVQAAGVVIRTPEVDLGYEPEATLTLLYHWVPSVSLDR